MSQQQCVSVAAVIGVLLVLAGGLGWQSAVAQAVAQGDRDFSGVWWSGPADGPEPLSLEIVGDAPELTAAGEARYRETREEKRRIDLAVNDLRNVSHCVPVGVPRIWAQPYPFEIAVRPELVSLTYEHLGGWRVAYMDEAPATAETALSLFHYGNSGAHWDGDTLVIESAAFHEGTYLDETGLPLTENLRTEERIRKLDADTLEVVTTVEEPAYYVKPWTVRATFTRHPEAVIEEYVCGYGVFETRYHPPAETAAGRRPTRVSGAAASAMASPVDLSGVWRSARGGRGGFDENGVMLTAAGEPIPFQAWSREVFYDSLADAIEGSSYIDNRVRCLPEGPVDIWSSVWALRIVQQADVVYLLIDYDNQVRRVLMGTAFPSDLKPTWNGTSVGHWEGETLVVETRGLNDKTALMTLAAGGNRPRTNLPHSTALRVVERFSLSADGQTLINEVTIDDPEAFTKPWTTVNRFEASADWRPQEETCADSSLEGTFSSDELSEER